jgi:hypothetical protein
MMTLGNIGLLGNVFFPVSYFGIGKEDFHSFIKAKSLDLK